MKKKKKGKKLLNNKKRLGNTVRYVCSSCGETEQIPLDVIEYFEEKNPEQSLFQGYHQFSCEKCVTGIMSPETKPEVMIKGFGLFDGIENFLK